MSSLSTQTEMSNRQYENALQNYYAGLAEGPRRDVKKEMENERSNELLDLVTAPIAAHFIDSGLENVKTYVNAGIKRAVAKGTDVGKQAVKSGIKAAAEKAGIAPETVSDLLEGKMDMLKTAGQAAQYVKDKAVEAGTDALARAGGSGMFGGGFGPAPEGDDVASAASKARGLGSQLVDEQGSRLEELAKSLPVPDVSDLAETKSRGFLSRLLGNSKPLNPQADKEIFMNPIQPSDFEYASPFTGEKLNIADKFKPPSAAAFDEDASGAVDFLTNATNSQKLVNRGRQLEKFRVLNGAVGEDGTQARRGVQVAGKRVDQTLKNLDNVFSYKDQAEKLPNDLFTYKPPVQPSALEKATGSLDDVAEQAASKVRAGLEPSYRVLADVLKGATTGEPKPNPALPDLERLKQIPTNVAPDALPDLPDVNNLISGIVRDESAPFTEAKNPSVYDDTFFDRSNLNTFDTAKTGSTEIQNPVFNPDDVPNKELDPEAESNLVNPFLEPNPPPKYNVEGVGANQNPNPEPEVNDDDEMIGKAGQQSGQNIPKPVPPSEEDKLGSTIGKALEKEAPEEIAGADFGPLGDIVDLGLAAGTILGAVFGQKHADAPAPLNFSNPTAPIGI